MYTTAAQPYQQYYNPVYNNNAGYVPLTAPTPLPTPAFYNNTPAAPTPATFDFNVSQTSPSADVYRYPPSAKNYPSYKYEEVTFELPPDYFSNQPTTYTVRDYNSGSPNTPIVASTLSRPPSTRPLSRTQPRATTPYNPQSQSNEQPSRAFTPNPFLPPAPVSAESGLRKSRKSRLQFQNSTPTLVNFSDPFTSASNLNMGTNVRSNKSGAPQTTNYSDYYMNAYSSHNAINQAPNQAQNTPQQQNSSNNSSNNNAQNYLPNDYPSKPPVYYNTFNNINGSNNNTPPSNTSTTKNMGYNSGRLSAVIDAMPKIQQRANSTIAVNNIQQQSYENQSAYFGSPNTPPPMFNPSLKANESGRLSRRQKSTPSTVHFASPLVTPIPYMDAKENMDPRMSDRKRQMTKETRSHSTIPAYRNQSTTPVNYSFEMSRGANNESKMKKYRPNTPGSIIADASPILNHPPPRKLATPGGVVPAPTPVHMVNSHHHHHHHHRHHSSNNQSAGNNNPSNYVRLCYLKPNSTNEFECKNIKINHEQPDYGTNYGCSLDDLKKKKKMKFLGVFKEAPSSASYDTMDSWLSSNPPESRIKYPENDHGSHKKRVNVPISGHANPNSNIYINHQPKYATQKPNSIVNDYGQSMDSNDSSFGFEEFGVVEDSFHLHPSNKKLDSQTSHAPMKTSSSREKLYKLIKDANGLVLLKEIS